ncbi:autotransporter outer membrane beta-barrel domain-containing protein [Devosia sp. MC521]|uniref:autotransporter outer membrane beta-barrel domain-containing protein n=1 Tax=Devosia sp. MC521 TaxID=2759954 RepID=UPI0015F94A58|nr:autotransporter outer membrane beta-barrel domain-containing protein [Devosia sp. MC521]MBJ6986776.1 autotransporter outer membrane beta-barrel domain-containing protein [Devosia sp. MC521]QMW61808.1 autotransporter outer membrane beta-barrel domain-containing protein [Devosia sp. MC521]
MPQFQPYCRRANKIVRAFAHSLARVVLGGMVFGAVSVVPSVAYATVTYSPDPVYTGNSSVTFTHSSFVDANWYYIGQDLYNELAWDEAESVGNQITFNLTFATPGDYELEIYHGDYGTEFVTVTVIERPVSPPENTEQVSTAEQISSDLVQARGRQLHAGLFSGMLQQRRQMSAARTPGTISINPAGSGVAMNFAASTLAMTAASQAVTELGQTVVVDDQGANFWIDGDMNVYARDNGGGLQWGQAGLVGAGVDVLVDKNLLVGSVLYGDWMHDKSDSQNTTGAGFLVGPYASAEVTPNVFFDVAALYGKSWNTLKFDDFTGDFSTDRVLARAELRGNVELGEGTRFRPNTTLFYMRENIAGYTVSNGAGTTQNVDANVQQQLTASAGGRIEHSFDAGENWVLTPHVSLDLGMVGTNGAWSQMIQGGIGTELVSDGGFKVVLGLDGNATAAGARGVGASAKIKAQF